MVSRSITPTLAILTLSSMLGACSEEKKSSKLTLKVRNAGDTAQSLKRGQSLLAPAGNLSFTPESYKLWISTIVLQNDSGLSNQFYQCDSSEADCEVDLADANSVEAFEAKLSDLEVTAGTYTQVWLACSPSSGGYIKVKGQTTLTDGTTMYTADPAANGGSAVATTESQAGTLKIPMPSCGLTMPLAKPLVVGGDSSEAQDGAPEGETVTMTIFSNLLDQVYYGPYLSGGMGGCMIASGEVSGPGFCTAYPSVYPYFGETTPAVEYYKVAHSKTSAADLTLSDVNVMVKVTKDAAGVPFWASFSSIYSETTPGYGTGDKGISGYANSVTEFAVNAESILTIKSQDSGFAAFQRTEHTGEVKGEGVENGAGTGSQVSYYYKAFPYTP